MNPAYKVSFIVFLGSFKNSRFRVTPGEINDCHNCLGGKGPAVKPAFLGGDGGAPELLGVEVFRLMVINMRGDTCHEATAQGGHESPFSAQKLGVALHKRQPCPICPNPLG